MLGLDRVVVGHQFKTSKFPGKFTIETLFTGANDLFKPLVHAWQCLRKDNPGSRVEIRLVVNDFPSDTDKPGDGTPPHSAAFLDEFERRPSRSLQDWRSSGWSRLIECLHRESGLSDGEFEQSLHSLRVVHGAAADFVQSHKLSSEQARLASEIGLRLRDDSLHERREQFGVLVKQAGERFDRDCIRTIIVVDGLDHVPREERPTHSLLGELPLPAAIPTGVTFVLGTQRLDLANLKPAVKDQAEKSDRLVRMSPLGREEVARMERQLLESPMFRLLRADMAIPNKRGRIPAWVPTDGTDRPDYRQMGRFLAKVGLEVLAFKTLSVHGWNNELVDQPALDELRRFARYNEGPDWPFTVRSLHPANAIFKDVNQSFELLHEFDILLARSSDAYLAVSIFGVEMVINLGGRENDGFRRWLEENNWASPLYVPRDAQPIHRTSGF